MNQILLTHHSTLLDLLEIPQLMDTYVFDCLTYALKSLHRVNRIYDQIKLMHLCFFIKYMIV